MKINLCMPSTAIAKFSYDPQKMILAITFVSGNLYHYKGVPSRVYVELNSAASKGSYFNRFIKNKYAYEHIQSG